MAKKKGNSNEAEIAETVAGALEPAVSAEHDEPAAAPVVEGDGGDAAGADGPEQPGEPAGAAGVSVGSAMEDGAEGQDAGGEADAPSVAAAERTEEVSDADAASGDDIDGEPDPAGGAPARAAGRDVLAAGDDGSGAVGAGCGDLRDGDAAADAPDTGWGDDGGNAGSDEGNGDGGDAGGGGDTACAGADLRPGADAASSAAAGEARGTAGAGGGDTTAGDAGHVGDQVDGRGGCDQLHDGRHALGENLGAGEGAALNDDGANVGSSAAPNHFDDPYDGAVYVAERAAAAVFEYLGEYYAFGEAEERRLALLSGHEHSRATNAIAACVRNIGRERATAAVIGQQLKIEGFIDDPELSHREELVVSTIVAVLAGIDAYDKEVAVRQALASATPHEPRPVPIDETTMETIDDPLATWER